jgi:NAD(P)-dependent dehydrogenase (short-subunit alcohol dehydrogenase family)
MGMRLEGKTALVTGATSNIGRAIAIAFGAEGAHVVVSGRSVDRGAAVVEQIRASGGQADFVAADLDGSPHISRDLAAEAILILGGRIDILVNNAGIFPRTTTATTDEETFDEVYGVNVKAPYFLTGVIAPIMADAAMASSSTWVRGSPASEYRAPSTAPPRAPWKPSPRPGQQSSDQPACASTPSLLA